jgi:hypothetical protein
MIEKEAAVFSSPSGRRWGHRASKDARLSTGDDAG